MALNDKWMQSLLMYEVTLEPPVRGQDGSDSGSVGRSIIDGVLVVYDPEDCPRWLKHVLTDRDEDGNYERKVENV